MINCQNRISPVSAVTMSQVLVLKKIIPRLFKARQTGRIFWIWRKLYLLSNWAGQEIKHQRFTKKFLMKETEGVIEKFH